MNQATLSGRDVFARHTGVDGKSFVQMHRVWDAERFFEVRTAEAQNLNADVKPGQPRLAKVEQITAEQYHAARKA